MKSGALPSHLDAFQNRYLPTVFSSPHYTLATMPSDLGRLSSLSDTPSRFRLAVPQPLIRENALRLLADSEHGTPKPMIPSQFTFATPGAQGFHPALYIDPNRTHPIFEFGDAPLKFHFVEDVTQ
jgi:outer membrane protein